MRMMPLVWEAKRRCIEFWIKVLKMNESGLIKWVVEEAIQMEKRVIGRKTGKPVDVRDWNDVKRQCMEEVKWKWEVEAQEQSKLGVMQRLLVHGSKDRRIGVKCKRLRSMLAMLKGATYCSTEN